MEGWITHSDFKVFLVMKPGRQEVVGSPMHDDGSVWPAPGDSAGGVIAHSPDLPDGSAEVVFLFAQSWRRAHPPCDERMAHHSGGAPGSFKTESRTVWQKALTAFPSV